MARPSARQRGYTREWERAPKEFLAEPQNRWCACGCGRLANMVDHIVRHGGDRKLMWSRSNWQPYRTDCHSRTKQQIETRGYHDSVDEDGYPTDPAHPFNRGHADAPR